MGFSVSTPVYRQTMIDVFEGEPSKFAVTTPSPVGSPIAIQTSIPIWLRPPHCACTSDQFNPRPETELTAVKFFDEIAARYKSPLTPVKVPEVDTVFELAEPPVSASLKLIGPSNPPSSENLAVTAIFESTVMVSVILRPLRSPLQPLKTQPISGAAVSVTTVPCSYTPPGGSKVTLPEPMNVTLSELVTVKSTALESCPSLLVIWILPEVAFAGTVA